MLQTGIIKLCGNFTMIKFLQNLNAESLERTIGFHKGRLSGQGYLIVVLAENEVLGPDDFELKASTRWSKGIMSNGRDITDILESRGFDDRGIRRLKAKVAAKFIQRGGNTPAKIIPNLRHNDSFLYPDAEALGPGIISGIPQFNIPIARPRKFLIIESVEPG